MKLDQIEKDRSCSMAGPKTCPVLVSHVKHKVTLMCHSDIKIGLERASHMEPYHFCLD